MLKKKKIKKNRKGFSMVEAVLSIFILSTGLIATIALISSSTRHSLDARNQIIASQLAQEGVELVTFIRDHNIRAIKNQTIPIPGDIFEGISGKNGDCVIDFHFPVDIKDAIKCPPPPVEFALKIEGWYVHGAGSGQTIFSRKINIVNSNNSPLERTFDIKSYVWWGAEPTDFSTDCTLANKCTLAQTILTEN
jgi:competence protein ComGC